MKIDPKSIDWGPLTPEGDALMEAHVAHQYNEIARKYGAKLVPVPRSELDPKPRPVTRYKMRSAIELLRSDPIKWRVKGVIPEQGIAAIYGPSGSGKSFLVLDLAISIAKNAEWFGYRVKSCPVTYVCLEGEAGLSVRLAAYRTKASIPKQIEFIDQPVNLLDSKDLRDLVMAIKVNQMGGGIVIIDTLNRAGPGADENSSVDMGKLIQSAKLIQQALGGLVLLVHHSGKDTSKGMRGHSSLIAALDAAIEVKRSDDDREWSVAKAKDGADGKGHPFMLEIVNMGEDEDGDPVTSCVIRPSAGTGKRAKPLTQAQQVGMDAFMAAASGNIGSDDNSVRAHVDQWRDVFYQRSTAGNPDSKRRAFSRVRPELVELGKLIVLNDVYQLPDGFPNLSK
jgi:energy-coupling factor transporter ATP-binding protein EcfA2